MSIEKTHTVFQIITLLFYLTISLTVNSKVVSTTKAEYRMFTLKLNISNYFESMQLKYLILQCTISQNMAFSLCLNGNLSTD